MKRLISVIVVASLLAFVCTAVALAETKADSAKGATTVKAAEPAKETATAGKAKAAKMEKQDTITTASGLKYVDIKVGLGAVPKAGQTVEVHYTGWLTDGKKFDSSKDKGVPMTIQFGVTRLVSGFTEGLSTMKIGGVRKLIIPPQLGYGPQAVGGGLIPPNSTLIFEVELLSAK